MLIDSDVLWSMERQSIELSKRNSAVTGVKTYYFF